MKPSIHVAASLSLGAVIWYSTKSFVAAVLYFVFAVFLDADHILDYGLEYGWKDITLMRVYRASSHTNRDKQEGGYSKLHIVFHTVEFAILFWVAYLFTGNIYFLAIALGYSTHLVLDYIGNPVYGFSYFFIWRAMKNFDVGKICKRGNV